MAERAAIVTGASGKGTWVRISSPTAEGRVVRGFEGLDVSDHVRVELIQIDVVRGFIDFRTSAGKIMVARGASAANIGPSLNASTPEITFVGRIL